MNLRYCIIILQVNFSGRDDMTRQKALILDILKSDACHHTAEEIFELAKERSPKISRATVYNNLHSLERERCIRKISGDDRPDRYDSSFIPHAHLVCTECGRVSDIDVSGIEAAIFISLGCAADSYELKIRAKCRECRVN